MEIENKKENIEETLTRIALKIAKQNKGCIFIIMNNKFDYSPLIEQDLKFFSVYENHFFVNRKMKLFYLHYFEAIFLKSYIPKLLY